MDRFILTTRASYSRSSSPSRRVADPTKHSHLSDAAQCLISSFRTFPHHLQHIRVNFTLPWLSPFLQRPQDPPRVRIFPPRLLGAAWPIPSSLLPRQPTATTATAGFNAFTPGISSRLILLVFTPCSSFRIASYSCSVLVLLLFPPRLTLFQCSNFTLLASLQPPTISFTPSSFSYTNLSLTFFPTTFPAFIFFTFISFSYLASPSFFSSCSFFFFSSPHLLLSSHSSQLHITSHLLPPSPLLSPILSSALFIVYHIPLLPF